VPLEAGQQLLHYRLVRKIGEGGMGVVFEATDTRLHRSVAVKVLSGTVTRDPERVARFHQEAQLAAALQHPNIATVHDVGEQDGVIFIVMELVRGRSLRSLVRDEPLPVGHALDLAIGIAAGLARAHREGVLHRDLKPDNVVLTDDGVPKILDFGLGKLIAGADPQGADPSSRARDASETRPAGAGDTPNAPPGDSREPTGHRASRPADDGDTPHAPPGEQRDTTGARDARPADAGDISHAARGDSREATEHRPPRRTDDDIPPSPAHAPPTEARTATQPSPYLTRAGQVVGTLAYMSPEQLQGRPVDARTDVFSFGVLLYEMLSGRQPFAGDSRLETATAILRDDPPPLGELRGDLPAEVQAILARCLAKQPDRRFASGEQLHAALLDLRRSIEATATGLAATLRRRPAALVAAALIVLLAGAGLIGMVQRDAVGSWARNEALPEIERLYNAGDRDGAMRLIHEALEIIPDDPLLLQHAATFAMPMALESEPPGAVVYVKGYNHPEREWFRVGETPLQNVPISIPTRFRVEKPGYETFLAAPFGVVQSFRLFREDEIPAGMVHVPGGTARFGAADPLELEDFWIDKYEVTNREYKAFVDDGGYRDDRLWPSNVDRGAFVDTTGRPGPAGWALGSYSEGEDELPVGGVSWFEASAYAAWAGKSLPTVFHWRLAARQAIFSEILLWSNFDAKGPAPVGSYPGLGPTGTYDMAGNVREWCVNRTGDVRHILGGAWSEPDYLYRDTDAADPFDRSPINGLRCMKTSAPPPDAALAAIEHPVEDHRQDRPIDDELFAIVRRDFDYDDRELDARRERAGDHSRHWRHEVVSVRTAYGDERLPLHLYLPKDAEPPYQAVVYFPPSSARYLTDSRHPSFPFAQFIPQSGRALVYPIFQGTYERRFDRYGPNDDRDHKIQLGKDLRRTVDYLETRDDIDAEKLAYYGLSWGAYLGPMMTAVEPRFAAGVLLSGGLYRFPEDWPPAAVPQNFAPRSTVPTLMINGRADFGAPVETNIRPMFDLLGTPDEHKRLLLLDGGHVPSSANEVIRAVLDWLDRYLGPVDTGG
jgi:serine/threonine protein kinase